MIFAQVLSIPLLTLALGINKFTNQFNIQEEIRLNMNKEDEETSATVKPRIDDIEHVEEQWAVPIVLNDAGDLLIAAGVPDVTCDGILKDRIMKDDSQLTFTNIPDHPCTPFGKNMIYFMIMEWFYFGR